MRKYKKLWNSVPLCNIIVAFLSPSLDHLKKNSITIICPKELIIILIQLAPWIASRTPVEHTVPFTPCTPRQLTEEEHQLSDAIEISISFPIFLLCVLHTV